MKEKALLRIKKMKKLPMIFLAVIMLVLTLYNLFAFKSNEINIASERVSLQMASDLDGFENWITDFITDADLIKSHLQNISPETLKAIPASNPYLNYRYTDQYTHYIFAGFTDGSFTSDSSWLPPDSYDPRNRPWYKAAVDQNKTLISDVYVGMISNDFVITVCTPLYYEDNLSGVLGITLILDNLNSKLHDDRSRPNFDSFIISGSGLVLADTDNPSSINQLAEDRYLYFLSAAQKTDGYLSQITADGKFYLYRYNPDFDWVIGTKTDLDSVTEDAAFWMRPQPIVNLLFWVLFMGVLIYIGNLNQELITASATLEANNDSLKLTNQKLEEANHQLAYRAVHDGLTGLYNRFALDDTLDTLISKGFQERKYIGIILFDVDDFKTYNDLYGHIQGDEALKTIASTTAEFCDSAVMTARYGGEEFAVLFYDLDIDEIYKISEQLRQHIQSIGIKHKLGDFGVLTISGGAHAILPTLSTSRGKFIHQADIALYKAKANGKNRFYRAYNRE